MTGIPAAKAFGFSREYLTISDLSTITGMDSAIIRDRLRNHAKEDKHADITFYSRGTGRTEVPLITAMAVFGILPSDLHALDERIRQKREEMNRYKIVPEIIEVPDDVEAFSRAWIERVKDEDDSENLLGHQRPVPRGQVFHRGEVLKLQRAFQRIGKNRQEIDTLPTIAWAQLMVWIADKKQVNITNIEELMQYGIDRLREVM